MQKQLFLSPTGEQQLNALTELQEAAQQKAKPLIEWWDDRTRMEKGINTFLVPYDFVALKASEKAVALMDKGQGIFNVVKHLQEEIVSPIKQENELLKEQNKKLLGEKNQLLALFIEIIVGDNAYE